MVFFDDPKRRILRVSIDPHGRLIATADNVGRVMLAVGDARADDGELGTLDEENNDEKKPRDFSFFGVILRPVGAAMDAPTSMRLSDLSIPATTACRRDCSVEALSNIE